MLQRPGRPSILLFALVILASILAVAPGSPAHAASYCYKNFSPWASSTLTPRVYGTLPGVTTSQFQAMIKGAAAQWNGHSSLHYNTPVFGSPTSTVAAFQVFVTSFSAAGLSGSPAIVIGALTHSTSATHTRAIVFLDRDSSAEWVDTGSDSTQLHIGTWDVWSVAVHEFGHAAGLAHPGDCSLERTSVMNQPVPNQVGYYVTRRKTTSYDWEWINDRY